MRFSNDCSTTVRREVIQSIERLEALRPQWERLWLNAPRATPFQSPDWLLPWWHFFGSGEIFSLALWTAERLEMLLPGFIRFDEGQRTLLLLGTGISDYLDLITGPEAEGFAASEVFDSLREYRDNWDICDCQPLQVDSPLRERDVPLELTATDVAGEVCPQLVLSTPELGLGAFVPKHQLANLRYYRARAAKLGTLEMETAGIHTIHEFLDSLFSLHSARWEEAGDSGVLNTTAIRRFHEAVSIAFLQREILRCYRLRLGRRTLAVFYGFTHRQRCYYYLGGFDPEFSQLSPGTLMIGCALERALEERAHQFDFLRGPENYKYLWGAKDASTFRRLIRH